MIAKEMEHYSKADTYAYDSIYRLVLERQGIASADLEDELADPGSEDSEKDIEYELDGCSNRLTVTTTYFGELPIVDDYTHDCMNRYTEINEAVLAYDDNGNLTSDGRKFETYSYDYRNQLVRITGQNANTDYFYDVLGRRIHKDQECSGAG